MDIKDRDVFVFTSKREEGKGIVDGKVPVYHFPIGFLSCCDSLLLLFFFTVPSSLSVFFDFRLVSLLFISHFLMFYFSFVLLSSSLREKMPITL